MMDVSKFNASNRNLMHLEEEEEKKKYRFSGSGMWNGTYHVRVGKSRGVYFMLVIIS